MKVFQILNDMCYVQMNCQSVAELAGKYPADIKFVEAPDYVNEHWGFCDVDQDGNPIEGDARFIHPVAPGFMMMKLALSILKTLFRECLKKLSWVSRMRTRCC